MKSDEEGQALEATVASLRDRVATLTHTELDLRAKLHELRAELASARKTSDEMSAAVEAKSAFLANMSHELRTPMTAILGYAELLFDEGELEKASPIRLEHLRTIKRNGQHLTRLLGDILDLSKIESGQLTVERMQVRLDEIMADIEAMMRRAARDRGIQFDVGYRGEIPTIVYTDPTRLRQVLANLVNNAIKFTEHGGVQLMVRLVHDGPNGDPMLRFAVTDTGIGIAPSALERIFEPFRQADDSMTRRFGGTGLGLAISRNLARLLGGDLTAVSDEGHGSTFTLDIAAGSVEGAGTLAAAQGDAFQTFAAIDDDEPSTIAFLEGVRASAPSARVLVVEDGVDNRRLFERILSSSGFDVRLAENGEVGASHALAARDSEMPFDLILMDMQMPVMDGYEATRWLRAESYEGPIVALTAHAMKGDEERCLNAGCDGFATKPIGRKQLVELVLRYTDKREGS